MQYTSEKLEQLTAGYGQELFARMDRQGPMVFSPTWLDDRLMEWSMHNEAIKLQLFRFIDVLPLLHDPVEITRHLREYFDEAGEALPQWARFGLRWLPRNGLAAKMLSSAARSNATRLARKFIAGSNLQEALDAIARMRRHSQGFTIDLLGEAVITEQEALQHQQAYLELITGLTEQMNHWSVNKLIDQDHQGTIPRVNVSVKLSSLYSQFDGIDPEQTSRVVRERLRPILRTARDRYAFVNIDMEQYASKDMTLQILQEVLVEDEFRDWPDVGVAIQAYLRSCEKDLFNLREWAKRRGTSIQVRLIKGAYWDYETVIAEQEGWETPVFTDKNETDANYEKMTEFLLANHNYLRPAFGSHNIRSLAHAMALAQLLGLPERTIEIQMLYGMADEFKHAMVSLGQRVRVYTPYGELLPGMAYLVRRLLENTANDSFLRASQTEHVPEEILLMNPSKKAQLHSPNGSLNNGQHATATTLDGFRNEPVSDFERDTTKREAMQRALEEVKSQFGKMYPVVINGETIQTEEAIDSVNPSNFQEVVGRCGRASGWLAEQAVSTAAKAFASWREIGPDERAAYLNRAAEVMRRRRFELAAWETYECGKQWREADADVCEAIDFCDYYALEMRRLANGYRVDLPGEENESNYEPRGVVSVIAPWNFPLAILTGMTAAALVTGNTVVMKPAEQSSVIGAKLMEIMQEIGLPPGVLNFLPGIGEEVGPTIVNHPDVAMIAFTGSRNVGLLINKQAADQTPDQDHVKRVLAEMGGKNAIIVDDDADLDEAVSGVVKSAFGYQGQKCSACSRVIVLENLHDTFVRRLVEATASLKIAPADEPSCKVGPVIDEEARNRILGYIEKGKEQADLMHARDVGELANHGYFIGPHIFANVDRNAVIAQEEIFGPVLAVIKAMNLDEALDIANDTRYALTGGFYSRSPANIKRVKRQFRVGNLYINRPCTGALVWRQPFGGFKLSGIGSKTGGPDYLQQFMVPRTITENTMRRGFAPEVD
ncbi:MAG: L-glutamate gamma-semialdehyde dehydrogenase [Gemmataceae bacterium]